MAMHEPVPEGLTLGEFLTSIFDLPLHGDSPRSVHLCSFPGKPTDPGAAWGGFRWAYNAKDKWRLHEGFPDDCNQYFSIGLLNKASIGRSDRLVYANPLVALDDVGTKVQYETVKRLVSSRGLRPAAVIRTSPGNHSLLYKVAERTQLERGDRVRAALCKLKLSDPAVHDRSRYMRLPFGVNAKRLPWFRLRLIQWRPQALTSYDDWEEAITAAGADLAAVHVPVVGDRAASLDDPWVKLAGAIGLDPHESTQPGVISAICPFAHEHSDQEETGFAFVNWERCHCFHGHCASRRTPDFLAEIARRYQEETGERAADFMAREAFALDDLAPEFRQRD
jgi:hypothetical protein